MNFVGATAQFLTSSNQWLEILQNNLAQDA
jgi:hypothetical protein